VPSIDKTWIELDIKNYIQNLNQLRATLNPNVNFCAVFKANAYGHGLRPLLPICYEQGVRDIGVDNIDEAIIARELAPLARIWILGYTSPERFDDVVGNDCIQTIYDCTQIELLGQSAHRLKRSAKISIKIETGTQRQGMAPSALPFILAAIEKERGSVTCVGIGSHFSSAELTSKEKITQLQNIAFENALLKADALGFKDFCSHISGSASALLYPSTHHNMVRVGLAQYGLWPSDEVRKLVIVKKNAFELKPVLTWKTRVAQIKDIATGTPVGYDQTFISDRPMRLAILPVGFFDGYCRSCRNLHVLIHGQKCPIVGTICMNMMIVNVSTVGQIKVHDTVTLLGRDGMNQITAEEIASNSGTINYEVVTRIGSHLPRRLI